jgi:formylglycine-generating enzyme required for sulfatase activity
MSRVFMSVLTAVFASGLAVQPALAQRAKGAPPKRETAMPVAGAERGASGLWEITVRVGNATFKLALIPAGSFRMGSSGMDLEALAASRPVHEVALSHSFWMAKVPVTQGQWQVVMGTNPSEFKAAGPDAPVEGVSWDDAQTFTTRLNGVQSQWTFRLPTESEWEYACRAGSQSERHGDLDAIAWYAQNSGRTTHPTGLKQPNAYGLYDMTGQVWQWCQDWYGEYPKGSVTDPEGIGNDLYGSVRVIRGGAWNTDGAMVRSAIRSYNLPDFHGNNVGFRLVATHRNP